MAAKKKPSAAQLAARAKFVAMVRAKSKAKKSATKKATVKKSAPKKAAKKKVSGLDKVVRRETKTNVHYSRISGIGDVMRKDLEYGAVYDTSLQIYLVKFANLSFSLWAVTSEGLKKALKHPEGRNQSPIVYRVKNWGIPKFEKMKLSELKDYK
jgi:hypothetical protein